MYKVQIRGNLFIHVIEGRSLANRDSSIFSFRKNVSDPWLEILIEGERILSTPAKVNTLNPKWNSKAVVPLCYSQDFLEMKVWEDDFIGRNCLGEAKISLQPVNELWERDEWVPLTNKKGEIHLSLKFIPFHAPTDLPRYEPLSTEFLYFPARKGGSLKLYQDAHAQELPLLPTKTLAQPSNVFDDMAIAFEKAKRFIYIAGWSVWTILQMRRDGNSETIGELLKRRAAEGVRVLILVWSEKLSVKLCRELFGTHELETVKFFKNSKVIAIAVLRQALDMSSIKENIVNTIYTHHMKLVVTDSPEKGLIGFVGGLDLTDGRWDTPEHPIWSTLQNIHKNDFYNGFVVSATSETGPREPWHDLHSRTEGPAAYDILCMFEERWKRQVPQHLNLLLPVSESEFVKPCCDKEKQDRIWYLQVLRSSDSSSSFFNTSSSGLTDINRRVRDTSCHHGIISLIRSCNKFLYIETQYFLGSAFAWETKKDTCAPNLVPMEIVEQICYSIRTGNPIRVYIVIPLCPEGDPKSYIGAAYMNDQLHWQYLTIQMMYLQIAKTLKEVGSQDHPEEYLLFLCLGKKLEREKAKKLFPSEAKPGTEAFLWQTRSRFIIYVHSKMVLADDIRIILGSANLNQRALDGARDTESAIAGSQVDYTSEDEGKMVNNGVVSEFRRSLWYEHTGGVSEKEDALSNPASKECICSLKEKSERTLFEYRDDEVDKEITFRFMKYPLKVEKDGTIGPYPGITNIPDFGLPVTGKNSFIPANITT